MLVLGRLPGESILIGDDLVVSVVEVDRYRTILFLGSPALTVPVSLRIGEKLPIGHGIVLSYQSPRGRAARIGVEAPRDIRIDREEIRAAKLRTAAGGTP